MIDINQIIARILSGEANVQDILELNQWLNRDVKHRQEFDSLKDFWSSPVEDEPLAMPELAFEKFKERLNSPNKRRKRVFHHFRTLSIAATVSLFIIGSFIVYLLQRDNHPPLEYYTYVCPSGNYQLKLPDGTVAHLNKNSQLTYSSIYGINTRQVSLDGEAYFDVVKSTDPFLVDMGEASIKVLGTKFNVQAYRENDRIVATLEEGSIVFVDKKWQTTMTPNQQLVYHKTSADYDLSMVEPELYSAWKENLYKYRGITMQELCQEWERIYGLEFELSARLKNIKVSGSFEYQQSMEQILSIMQKSIDFKWKRKGNQIIIM